MSKSDFNKRTTVERLMKANQKLPRDLVEDFADNKDVVLYAIAHNPYDALSATDVLTNDKDFMMKALDLVPAEHKNMVYTCGSYNLADDSELFLKAFKSSDPRNAYEIIKDMAGDAVFNDRKTVKEALTFIHQSDWADHQKRQITDYVFLRIMNPDLTKEFRSFKMESPSPKTSKGPKHN